MKPPKRPKPNPFGMPFLRSSAFPAGGSPPSKSRSKRSDGQDGYIDLLWKGILLVEHKSRGKDLDCAFKQARDYFSGLKESDLPRYILVSDFARFRLYDLEEDTNTNSS